MEKSKENLYEFIRNYDSLRFVNRWNGTLALDRSNVLEHTGRGYVWVTIILKEFEREVPISKVKRIYELWLVHDFAEKWTSDIPHPTKRFSKKIRSSIKEIENTLVENNYPYSKSLCGARENSIEEIIITCVDILDFTYESLKEKNLSNKEKEYEKAITIGRNVVEKLYRESSENSLIRRKILKWTIDFIDFMVSN